MSEERCPNCRTRRSSPAERCEHCGWVPLRTTELQFVDDEQLACPNCGAVRPINATACPRCGTRELLEALADNTQNFRISSLLMLTTLVGICLALCRLAWPVGIAAFVITGLATWRTVLLVGERKKHRYPVVGADLGRFFAASLGGVVLGFFIFGVTWTFGMMLLGAIAAPIMYASQPVALVIAVIFLVATHVGAAHLIYRRLKTRAPFAVGGAVGLLAAVVVALAFAVRLAGISEWTLILPVATGSLGTLVAASRRGSGWRAQAFLTGHSAMISLVGLAGLSLVSSRSEPAAAFLMSGFLLVPILLSMMVLQSVWKWDDAFPRTLTHARPAGPSPRHARGATQQGVRVRTDDEGIVIIDEAEPTEHEPA